MVTLSAGGQWLSQDSNYRGVSLSSDVVTCSLNGLILQELVLALGVFGVLLAVYRKVQTKG